MTWLKPTKTSTDYDPHQRVSDFLGEYGRLGEVILDAVDNLDPFHCLYDDPCAPEGLLNPDEYLGYAQHIARYLLKEEEVSMSDPKVVRFAVLHCFSTQQLLDGWITPNQRRTLTEWICHGVRQI